MRCTRLAENTGHKNTKKSPSAHHLVKIGEEKKKKREEETTV